jgi:succinyl-CoA synthetase beta subunit
MFTHCLRLVPYPPPAELQLHTQLHSEGGTSIEDLAEKFPEKIIKIPVDIRVGITDDQALQMAKGLAVTGDMNAAADQIKRLYQLFASSDCTMVEVSRMC